MTSKIVQRVESLAAHVSALRTRHRKLDRQILEEQHRPAPDYGKLRWLKARRLVLRDQVARYEGLMSSLKPLAGHSLARKGAAAYQEGAA